MSTTKVPASMTAEGVTAAQITTLQGRASALEAGTSLPNGVVLQVASSLTATMTTTTTTIPGDDTIPQITEGAEFTTLAFTPKRATSTLLIQVIANVSGSVSGGIILGLFQDATANALAATWSAQASNAVPMQLVLTYSVSAASTSARTYRARAGMTGAGTLTFNGAAGARYLGGAMVSGITVTEIAG